MTLSKKEWTTYRMADGSLIFGDYAWVEHSEFFEEADEPVHVIKETWVLQSSEEVIFHPSWWDEEDYEGYYRDTEPTKEHKNKRKQVLEPCPK